MAERDLVQLGEVVDLLTGHPFKSADFSTDSDDIPLLRGDNVAQRYIRWDGVKRWPVERAEEYERYRLQAGDVVLAMDRPWIEAGLKVTDVRSDGAGALLVQRVARLRGTERIDQGYLKWALYSPEFTAHVLAVQTRSTVPHISPTQIREFRLNLPPLDEQRRIAKVLGAFDDLIAANQILADDLVRLAQLSLSCAHWPSQRVGDVAVLNRGLSYKGSGLRNEADDDCTPMINLANFTKSGWIKTAGTKLYAEPFKSAHVLAQGDLVVANTDLTQAREILGRGVLVSPAMEGAIHSHHTTSIRFPDNPVLTLFLWAQLQTQSFRERALGYATGTTVTALPKEAVLDYMFHVPEDWEHMAEVGQALLDQAWACEAEIDELTRTRDELLPLLISGRVGVAEMEGMVWWRS